MYKLGHHRIRMMQEEDIIEGRDDACGGQYRREG